MKKVLTTFLSILLILQTLPIYALVDADNQPFSDVQGHWAEKTIKRHYEMGMLKGYPDGTFRPDQTMLRSELISLINRYFGLKKEADINFKDVTKKEWYAEDAAKAKYYQYIQDLELRPQEEATREDVINMLSLILDIEEQKVKGKEIRFKDLEDVDKKTKERIEKFSRLGYIKGYGSSIFAPKGTINRAEIMTIVENTLGYIVKNQEDVDNIPAGVTKVTIINPNIVIENKKIKGDIYISSGATGKVTIRNTEVEGQIEIAGGSNIEPVKLENVEVEKVVITRAKETPKVEIKGQSSIGELRIKSETNIKISGETKIQRANTQAKTELELGEKTEIVSLTTEGETKVRTEQGSKIGILKANSKTEITGKGEVEKAYINDKGVSIETRPKYTKVDNHVGQVDIGGKEISHRNDDYNPSSGSSRGSSGTNPVNHTPIANDDVVKVDEDGEVLINVVSNDTDVDGDNLIIQTVSEAAYGQVYKQNTDIIKYKVGKDFNGSDSFTYIVSDGKGGIDEATVHVTIEGINDAPIANDDIVEINEDEEMSINVLSNDIDAEGDELTVTDVVYGNHGSVTIEDNWVKYVPTQNYNGSDSFEYTISDGNGGTDTATVNVKVNPVNDEPTISNRTLTVDKITENSIDLSWIKAKDVESAQTNLQYKVYYSINNSLDTVEEIESNGILVGDYEADINTKTIAGLENGKTYYVNVIVEDEEEEKAAYNKLEVSTLAITNIVVKTELKTTYIEGQTLDLTGLVVTLTKSDGSMEDVSFDEFEEKGIMTEPLNNVVLNSSNTAVIIKIGKLSTEKKITVKQTEMQGWGTVENPFIVQSIEDLVAVGRGTEVDGYKDYGMDKYYELGRDLDFTSLDSYQDSNGKDKFDINDNEDKNESLKNVLTKVDGNNKGFKPIGECDNPFKGTFNGNGHIIANLYINRSQESYIGLFRYANGATISNLGMENVIITGGYMVGGLVGEIYASEIKNCYEIGKVTGKSCVGGFVGRMVMNGTITNSYAIEIVTGERCVGGFVGDNNWGQVKNSYVTRTVTGNDSVGGIVGINEWGGSVINSVAFNSSVSGISNVGRVIGRFTEDNYYGTVNNYANEDMSILEGEKTKTIEDGLDKVDGVNITAYEFKTESYYTNSEKWDTSDGNSAWDFTNIWEIKEGADRPTLQDVGNDDGKVYKPVM